MRVCELRTRRAMLPRLDHLSLLPTGVRSPNLPDDLVSAVLDAVAAGDAEDACQAAASWCAVDSGNNRVCNENWERLTNLVFANAPVIVPNNARANFYALCNRARSYRMERRRLNASSSQEDGDVKVFVLAALYRDIEALPWASPRLRADPEVQLSAKESEYRNGHRMLHNHPEDQSVRRLVLAAFEAGREIDIDYVSEELRSDPQIMLAFSKLWQFEPDSFTKDDLDEVVPEELQNDRSFVLELVQLGGFFKVVAERFQNDREVVLAAVQSDGRALEYAPEKFRNDREIVIASIKEDAESIVYASDELKNDREILMMTMACLKDNRPQDFCLLWVVSSEMKNDREFVLAAVERNGEEFGSASDELKNDREFVLEVIQLHACTFKHASKELRDDDEVVALALYQQEVDGYGDCDGYGNDVYDYMSEEQKRKFNEWLDKWNKRKKKSFVRTYERSGIEAALDEEEDDEQDIEDALRRRYERFASR